MCRPPAAQQPQRETPQPIPTEPVPPETVGARRRISESERVTWPDGEEARVRQVRDTRETDEAQFFTEGVLERYVTKDGRVVSSISEVCRCQDCKGVFHLDRMVWCPDCGQPVCPACSRSVGTVTYCKQCGRAAWWKRFWGGLFSLIWKSGE